MCVNYSVDLRQDYFTKEFVSFTVYERELFKDVLIELRIT